MRKALQAISLLWLAPILGVSCGDPMRSAGVEVAPPSVATPVAPTGTAMVEIGRNDPFLPLALVTLFEPSRWCATVKIGGVIAQSMCIDTDLLPVLAWMDTTRDLVLFIVDRGETIEFTEGNARKLDSTAHWVVAQLRSEMEFDDVRFTVSSLERGVRYCVLTNQLFLHCTR
jgi:hypothetical protein